LGVSERTVYRDIAELVAQGAPIAGAAGIGYILGPGLFLPPLMLTEDETEAVVLGLRYVAQRGDAVLGAAAGDALAKVAAVLSPEAERSMRSPISLPGPPGVPFPSSAIDLGRVRSAIRRQAKLRLDYADGGGVRTERIVWPLAIAFLNAARVIVAFCELRDGYRTFRTDRIAALSETGGRYGGNRMAMLEDWRRQATAPDRS
jgi:predicted DNA-binding transcriptional regulator YafY